MKAIAVVFVLFFSTSCSFSRMASNLTADIMKAGSPVFEEEQDIEVAEQSALAMLKTIEAFHRHNPENETYLLLLAKSYATYAFGFLETRILQYEGTDPERYARYVERDKLFNLRGKEYGLRLIARQNPDLRKAIDAGLEPLRRELANLKRDEIEPVFWTAIAWGHYINWTKDSVRSVSDLTIVETLMGRVLELDPTFFYGGPHLFYGVYFASRPPMLGGDPKKAREHFDKAAGAAGGKFLMPIVLEAQYLAVQMNDKALFDELLAKVEAGSLDDMPEQRLANALAKERAKFMKANEKNYF